MVWLVVVAALVLGIVVALAIPVQLDVSAELTDRLRGRVRLRWWFAVVNIRSGSAAAKKRQARTPPRPAAAPRSRGRAALAALRTHGLVPRVARLVG
ncbi:MAG: hypothetical protein AB7N29_22530, partial [Vicinamibacterales bacterium]